MENLEYLFAAYLIFFLIIGGYAVSIVKRQKTLEKSIEALKEEA